MRQIGRWAARQRWCIFGLAVVRPGLVGAGEGESRGAASPRGDIEARLPWGPTAAGAAGTRSGGRWLARPAVRRATERGSGTVTTPRGGSVQYGGAAAGRTGPAGGAAGQLRGRRAGDDAGWPDGDEGWNRRGRCRSRQAPPLAAGQVSARPAGLVVRRSASDTAERRSGRAGRPTATTAVGWPSGRMVLSPAVLERGGGVGPGGTAAARRGTYYVSRTGLRTQGTYVRTGFRYYNTFTPAWYARVSESLAGSPLDRRHRLGTGDVGCRVPLLQLPGDPGVLRLRHDRGLSRGHGLHQRRTGRHRRAVRPTGGPVFRRRPGGEARRRRRSGNR